TCDDCHITNSWTSVNVDHSAVTGTCTSCHNGTTATGKHATHVQTSSQCEECHSTVAWIPANFNHDLVTGSCSSCHNGTTAAGKPGNHFTTSVQCDECHNTNNWFNIDFTHSSAIFPGDHRSNVTCLDCHTTNNEIPTWTTAGFKPDCAGCHSNDYKSGPHKKHENPDVKYTVSELRDCAGACHTYEDSSLTTIKENRNGEHRTTDGDF
ncbi:MAG: hypothetical protein KUG71_04385, partial [Porticoccaceae bacterium]|nr:hypothetical protein [Porticoccaceae bacterium]